jgi:arabinose-5-phosphate isomerase
VITPNETLRQALYLMEDRTSEISVLPVVDQNGGKAAGLLRLHDLCSPDLAGA